MCGGGKGEIGGERERERERERRQNNSLVQEAQASNKQHKAGRFVNSAMVWYHIHSSIDIHNIQQQYSYKMQLFAHMHVHVTCTYMDIYLPSLVCSAVWLEVLESGGHTLQ